MSQSNSPPRLAPGPDEPFDVNVDDASFDKLAQLQHQYGDVVRVTQRQRQSPALVLNNPEHVRHVLIGNNRNYEKGVGFERQLHDEVDALGRAPEFNDLGALNYTRQVVDETLRLYPPVWLFSRKAIAEDILLHEAGAVHIAAGTDIFLCPWLLHRDARYWQNPESFLPKRFNEQNSKERNRHAYYPFSLGSRRCIGEFFSVVHMQLHLVLLAQHIRLKHVSGEPVTVEPHINLRSRYSIMMMPEIRK